jgi:ribosome biogenesis GTPase / thiamine phosphate phosphatase
MIQTNQAAMQLEDFGWSAHFRRAEGDFDVGEALRVRVMAVHRDAFEVAGPDFSGRIASCGGQDGEGQPTVGDWLAIDPATHRIVALYPRFSLFRRRSAGNRADVQLIGTNVDTVLIVTSANQDFNVARIERYLTIALEAGVTPVIVITKADLAEDAECYVKAAQAVRRGVFVEALDSRSPDVARLLSLWLARGQTVALLGMSGVGKSTIINTLMGREIQDTSGIRDGDARGRHTTTGRSLHRTPGGAWLMDTPGMRELQIVEAGGGIEQVFDDVAELARRCRFSDCSHGGEPGCAVRTAIDAGEIEGERLTRFQKLQREDRRNSEQVHEAHARDKRFGRMTREAMKHKQWRNMQQ